MSFFKKFSSKNFSHSELQNLVVLCGGVALLIAIAVVLSGGVALPIATRVTDTLQKSLSSVQNKLSAAMYQAVTYTAVHSYGAANSAFANFVAPIDTAAGYPAPLGCSRTNGSLTSTICAQATPVYNTFGVFGVYETYNPARGYFQTFTADLSTLTGSHRGWAAFWSAPNIYQKTATGEILLTNAGRGLGSPPNEETIAAYIFNGGPTGDPGLNAPSFMTPGAPSYGLFSNGRYFTINNGAPLAEDTNAYAGVLYSLIVRAPTTWRASFAPGGANAINVPAGTNMALEWTCQPYQIQYWNESSCGGALGGSDCSSAKAIRLFNSVVTAGLGFAQIARTGTALVRPYRDPSIYNLACVSPAFSYNATYTNPVGFRYVIPARNGPTMSMVVNVTYPTPVGAITAIPISLKLPLGASPSVGGAGLSWYVDQNSTALCAKFGPTYVASSSAVADPNSGLVANPGAWSERVNCGSAAAPNFTAIGNFTRPGTYTYSTQGAVLNTLNAWIFTTVGSANVAVSCGTKTTWNTATNQCQCQAGFASSDGINCSALPTPVTTLTPSPAGGPIGTAPTLSWTATNGPITSCTATASEWPAGAKAAAPSSQLQPALNTVGPHTYLLHCANAGGNGSDASATVTICASGQIWNGTSCVAGAKPVTTLTPPFQGGSAPYTPRFSWSATNGPITDCTAGGTGTWTSTHPGISGTNVAQPVLNSPGTSYTYTMFCTNAAGDGAQTSASVSVCASGQTWNGSSCIASAPILSTFTATPNRVRLGTNVTRFDWTGTNLPANCALSSSPSVPGTGSVSSSPTSGSYTGPGGGGVGPIQQTTIFRLTCGSAPAGQATVTVIPQFEEI